MASDRIQRRIDSLLDEADQAIANEDWPTVASRARAVLRLDSENTDALSYLAAAEQDNGSSQPDHASPATPPVSAPRPEQPTSFADGRYQVMRFLGEGGKKKVYLAHDTTLDREVAFALIKSEGLDETSRTRIQREAQAMGRLGSHSHIVTVFDLGEEQGQPYMVTELMGGGDVEGAIEDAPDHRLPLQQAINIAQETCRGMEFAHSRGIVHRDLKPGNVWLTSDGIAKIGDFGLAVALDRSRLTTEGMMVGTVSYMPPEQAMGGEVTPRSDLYSLGAMVYEMVTGRPPFLGDDSVAIIGQHINTPPVAPTWHNGNCPRPLEALIMRLLAKDPSDRPESASDVLSALDAVDLTEAPPLVKGDGGISDPHALDSLAGGVFVGRQKEMGDLKAALEDALSGRGRLVTLVGEPGIGKSRTAQELTTYAGLRGAQVLWGRSYEEQGVPPYWPWVQAIRSYVRERDPEQLRSEMGAGAADIAEVVSDIRERLPDLQPAPQLEPEQARFRLFDSIAAFLRTASQRQPLVLVLDDLHWADQPSLALLQFVARELGGARLLIIGTYRDMELSRQHPLAEALGELNRERLFQRVLLRGLTQEDVGRFIEMTSGHLSPRGLIEAVHTQTEGNPLFVTEVVRLLVQEGELGAEQASETDSWTIRIPEGVREVIGRRLNRLTQRCNEALTVASLVGREFTSAQLGTLVEEVTDDRLFEILEEALAARVIEELPQSVGRYQFTHALIQETLTSELSLTRRVRLHAHIARSLEDLYGDEADAHAAELAHHFAQAEAVAGVDKLVRYSLVAAERASAAFAHEEAQAHFKRGLVARDIPLSDMTPPPDEEAAVMLFGLGRAQASTLPSDQFHLAVDQLRRAFGYFAKAGDVARALAVAEYPLPGWAGYITGVTDLIASALQLAPPDSPATARLLYRHGLDIGRVGSDYDAAKMAFDRALAIASRDGDISLEMWVLVSAAQVDVVHHRSAEALDKSLRIIELCHQVVDLHALAYAHQWAAVALMDLGDFEQSRQHAEASLPLAEKLRDRTRVNSALWLNMTLCQVRGDWPGAREFAERGLALPNVDTRILEGLARMECEVGNFSQSQTYLDELLSVTVRRLAFPEVVASAALVVAQVARVTGVAAQLDLASDQAKALQALAVTPRTARIAHFILALVALGRNDVNAAKQQYAALISYSKSSEADRLLGLLSHLMGDSNQAAGHFDDTLSLCRRSGLQPELAWTCCDYADLLKERDAEGDRARAVSLLDESLAISSELGMRPLMERVLSRREILKA